MTSLKSRKSMSSKISVTPKKEPKQSLSEARQLDIHVMVEGFENLHGLFQASDIFVQAEFLNIVIGESPQQAISANDYLISHNFHCILRYYPDVPQCIDDLISNPIIFNVYQVEGIYDTEHVYPKKIKADEQHLSPATISSVKGSRVGSKAPSQKKTDPKSKSLASSEVNSRKPSEKKLLNMVLIGRCNIDLLPLLLGEKEVKETLIIHPDTSQNVLDDTITSETSLPRLRAYLRAPISPIENLEDGNVLEFSVESIYNIPSEILQDNMRYTIGTPLPINSEVMETVLIRDGIVKKNSSLEKLKIWSNLTGLESRAAYSKYKFDDDLSSIKNPLSIDLENSILNSEKHIEWNTMRRIWLRENCSQVFVEKLRAYRKWPIEILGTKSNVQKQITLPAAIDIPIVTPSSKELIPNVERSDVHLMGFLDLTKLLFTGVTGTRVVCQLHSFNMEELRMETGHNIIFKDPYAGSITSKTKSNTHKKSRKSEKDTDDAIDQDSASHDTQDLSSTPLKLSLNEPTFIIIEVRLLRPFFPAKTIEELQTILTDFIPTREPINRDVITIEMAENELQNCLEDLIQVIYQEYNDFVEKRNTKVLNNLTGDDEIDFVKFLNSNGANNCFKTILKKKIYHVVSEKFPFKLKNQNNIHEWDEYINEIYVYLIKKINTIVNCFISPTMSLQSLSSDNNIFNDNNNKSIDNILLYAKEAEENDKLNLAERYYLELIDNDKTNCELLLYYAIFQFHYNNINDGFKLIRECLKFDPTYKYGLIFLGLLLHKNNDYDKSEACFQAVTTHYPDYLIGWVIFHLFYLSIENYEGVDVTLEQMNKCLRNEQSFNKDIELKLTQDNSTTNNNNNKDSSTDSMSSELIPFECKPELSWNVKMWEPNQMYARTIVLLLKFKCFEFVKIALAQELLTTINKISYSYYNAVCYYLLKQYDIALIEIQDVLKIIGPNIDVGGLIGYCNYKLCNYQDAIEYFQSILYEYDCNNNILLVYTYLTYICKHIKNQLDDALKYILLGCKYTPTPNIWLLAGIIYYDKKDFKNAEICLKESNQLDNKLSDTWKYLSLINQQLGNESIAEQCMKYANKYKLSSFTKNM